MDELLPLKAYVSSIVQTLDWQSWNWNEVLYALVAAVFFAALIWLLGIFGHLKRRIRRMIGERRFDREVRETCTRVIAVGQREGFRLEDVYVPLDLAPSDLAGLPRERMPSWGWRRSFVLLGGPGAGKSTWVKHTAANWRLGRAFFVRLRDLPRGMHLTELVARQAESAGIPDPAKWVQGEFANHGTLVVLDGLDEVRTADWDEVCGEVNAFAKTFASGDEGLTLIVTCRKEAFRTIPIELPDVREVRPLTDQQIVRFARKWPPGFPSGKSEETFMRDLDGSERVLELARSPLMLVGALMQYTESNLGIPDERKDYLERIARWLLEDWAKAQGHPADEWRKAYDPVLSALALQMHVRGIAEIPREDGAAVIRATLPRVGLDGGKTDAFIEKLATKTGILVRDTPGYFVFSQFSLQEYFASKALAARYGPEKIAALPMDWWRESVLLAVAQVPEPASFFQALFEMDPVIGVSAVAEYPTPPLVFQGTAVAAALDAIDQGLTAITDSVITLSRKVEGKHERDLIRGLEDRLRAENDAVAVEAGRVLARSGTQMATDALISNSITWNRALSSVSYLSTTFENVLVECIRGSDEDRADAAATVILGRLSDDRREELVIALDTLPENRAASLARGLLRSFGGSHLPPWYVRPDVLRVACYCAPHLDLDLEERPTRQVLEEPNLGIAWVAAELQDTRVQSPADAFKLLSKAATWAVSRRALLWGLSSSLILGSLGLPNPLRTLSVVAGIGVGFATAFLGRNMVPWFPVFSEPRRDLPLLFLAGAAVASAFFSGAPTLLIDYRPFPTIVASGLFALVALRHSDRVKVELGPDAVDGIRHLQMVLSAWILLIALVGITLVISDSHARLAASLIGLTVATLAALVVGRMLGASRRVAGARNQIFRTFGPPF